MIHEPKYRIVEVISSHFEVQKEHSFLWYKYWRTEGHWVTTVANEVWESNHHESYQSACNYCNDELIKWSIGLTKGSTQIRKIIPFNLGYERNTVIR